MLIAVWDYYNVTGDRNFIALYGAEMMLEIARFWGLKAIYNEKTDRYDIDGARFFGIPPPADHFAAPTNGAGTGVMGPDEFHEKYPDTDKAGLKNNAYTNVMVAWLLDKALLVLNQLLPEARREEMMNRLHLSKLELDRWEHITFRMTVPFLTETPGIIAQFEGWEQLLVRACRVVSCRVVPCRVVSCRVVRRMRHN
jgi:trehalose/maltose hydrolase-like predicted phosphorylase